MTTLSYDDLPFDEKQYVQSNVKFFVTGTPDFNLGKQAACFRSRPHLHPILKEKAKQKKAAYVRDIELMKKNRDELLQKVQKINSEIKRLGGTP